MDLFLIQNYQDLLTLKIKENKALTGYKGLLAQAAECHRSHLSQVIHGKVHLTPEQALGLGKFWSLAEDELTYFLDLVHFGRAGSAELRGFIGDRLAAYRAKRELKIHRGERKGTQRIADPSFAIQYYSEWHLRAIHLLVTIPEFQEVGKIAKRLGLPIEDVSELLSRLEGAELIRRSATGWLIDRSNVHLDATSSLNAISHLIWRQRAFEKMNLRRKNSFFHTALYSMSKADAVRLREMVNSFIDTTRELVRDSNEEELYALNCDFFEV